MRWEMGDRRLKTGDWRQDTGDGRQQTRRWETGDQEMGDRRLGDVRQETRKCETGDQEMGSRRQETGERRQFCDVISRKFSALNLAGLIYPIFKEQFLEDCRRRLQLPHWPEAKHFNHYPVVVAYFYQVRYANFFSTELPQALRLLSRCE